MSDHRAKVWWWRLLPLFVLILIPAAEVFADTASPGVELTHSMTVLAVQLGLIIFVARFAGLLAVRVYLPALVGQLLAGVVIGPYLLGSVPLPFLPDGLFPLTQGAVPVSLELYGFASMAAVIMLFISGLETDLKLLMRFSLAASVIGMTGAVVTFIAGASAASLLLGVDTGGPGLGRPISLLVGTLSMSASMGIVARVLAKRHKLDSPEGVTVIASAVVQDVIAIIGLAVVVSLIGISRGGGEEGIGRIVAVSLQALLVWIGFSALSLLFGTRLGGFLKRFRKPEIFSVMAMGLAFFFAGLLERAGVAMVVGAYVLGLSLSRTDIRYVIQERLVPLEEFFVPIFFTVMGMLVNVRVLVRWEALAFGLGLTAVATIVKFVASIVPALFLGFNRRGALRIGTGLMPRGEVALIIAAVGLSAGVLGEELFGGMVLMVLISTIVGTVLFGSLISRPGSGTRETSKEEELVSTHYNFDSETIAELLLSSVLRKLDEEGFFFHRVELETTVFHLRRDSVFITLQYDGLSLTFDSDKRDVGFIHALVSEAAVSLHESIHLFKEGLTPQSLQRKIEGDADAVQFDLRRYLNPASVKLSLQGTTKEQVIKELVGVLHRTGTVNDKKTVVKDVLERERALSTGMTDGIAIPHARSEGVSRVSFAVGLKPGGIEFDSMDGGKSNIFVMILSPKKEQGPHLQILAAFAGILNDAATREQILSTGSPDELMKLLVDKVPKHQSKASR